MGSLSRRIGKRYLDYTCGESFPYSSAITSFPSFPYHGLSSSAYPKRSEGKRGEKEGKAGRRWMGRYKIKRLFPWHPLFSVKSVVGN
jgi:hypothetical protein